LSAALGEAYSVQPYSISAKAELPKEIPWAILLPYFIFGLPFLVLLVYWIGISIKRYFSAKAKRKKSALSLSDLSPEELQRLYGSDLPEEFTSPESMSRDELKLLALKELEKQGRKPGDIDYRKGPLDWDDVDENFHPRPKVIRSDISKIEPSEQQKEKSNREKNKKEK
jgi:hypothetical protein